MAASRTRPGTSMPGRADAGPRVVASGVGGDEDGDQDRREDRDRDGQQEQRLPAERADEQAADERADGRARRDEHVEQPERRSPPIGRGERPDQRDRGRRDQRAADRLEDARRLEHLERGGDHGEQRRQRERADPDEEDRPLAVSVAEAAAGEQRDRHRPEVQRDERGDGHGVHAELVHDARQGDREHRRVERHEHRAAGDPEHRRAEQPSPARTAHRRRTIPVVPSISTRRPSAIRVVASPVPTTAGSSNSRATTAACESTPPVLVMRPPAIANSGTHDGFDEGQTMMSPGWTAPKSSWVRVSRAGPRAMPAEAPVPRISSAVGRLVAGAVEAIDVRVRRRFGWVRRLADPPRRADGRPMQEIGPSALDEVVDGPARADEARDLVAVQEQDVGRRRDHPGGGETSAGPDDVPAQRRLRAPVDPVVVDLGQRPDPASLDEQLLETGRGAPGRPPGPDAPSRRAVSASGGQVQSPGLGVDRHRMLDALGDLVEEELRFLDPRRQRQVVVHLAEVTVLVEEGPQCRHERVRGLQPGQIVERDPMPPDQPFDGDRRPLPSPPGARGPSRPRGARGRSRRSARAPRPARRRSPPIRTGRPGRRAPGTGPRIA